MNFCDTCKIVAEFSQKLLIFQTDFFAKFWDCSGAKGCKSCRAWKMLSNAYFQDICGNLLGEGGSQMSNFLTNAVRARYSRVNHDVPLKDYMWHVLDVHVVLVWNIHCLEHVKYWIWKERSHCKARGALSHSGLGALSPLDFWLRLLLWSRCGFLLRGAEHQPDRVLQLLQWRLLILLLFYVTPSFGGGGLPSGASGDGSMHFEVNELLGYYGTGSV